MKILTQNEHLFKPAFINIKSYINNKINNYNTNNQLEEENINLKEDYSKLKDE